LSHRRRIATRDFSLSGVVVPLLCPAPIPRSFLLELLLVTTLLAVAGCARGPLPLPAPEAPAPEPVVITPVAPLVGWLPAEVEVRTAEPELAAASTFAVVPAARVGAPRAAVGSTDQLLLYGARNGLEGRGYQWVEAGARNPDLVAAVDWRLPSLPGAAGKPLRRAWPSRVTLLPGDVDAIEVRPEWGLWPPSGGAPSADPVPPPPAVAGETLSWRTPEVQLSIFDSSSGTLLWEASASAGTQEWRPGVSLSRILDAIVARLPRARRPAHRLRRDEGRLGVRLWMATSDGRHFYPRVEALAPGMPAEQELAVGDRILEIETTAAADLPLVDLYELLRGPPGTVLRLRVQPAAGGEPRVVYIRRTIGRQP
jgi:hypothetical protein